MKHDPVLLCTIMPVPVIISKATITMEDGVILRWLKNEGESVGEEDVLFELETDKAVVEVGAPASGTLLKIVAAEGAVKVGSVVGWIGKQGDSIEKAPGAVSLPPPEAVPSPPAGLAGSKPGRILSTPAARRRAAELGIPLESVQCATPGGRISQEDVEQAAAARSSKTAQAAPQLDKRRSLIQRLATTWQSVPHIHIARLLDADGLAQTKKVAGAGITITDLLLHLTIRVLPLFPALTMVWSGEELVPSSHTNLAFAVETDRGVVAPVISAAEVLSLEERSRERRRLTEAARAHRLRPEDLQGGVFTVTNLGMQGVDFFAPLINAPQTAILATGKMRQEAVVREGEIAPGWRMWANLAVDHRVADGVTAAQFLENVQLEIGKLSMTLDANA